MQPLSPQADCPSDGRGRLVPLWGAEGAPVASWAPLVWPSRLPSSSRPGPSLLPSAIVSVHETGHLSAGRFPCFPRLVQNLPHEFRGNLPKFFCKASLHPRKGTGRRGQPQPVTPEAPSPPRRAQAPRVRWPCPGCRAFWISTKRVPSSALDLYFWGHLSETARLAFSSSLGTWRWPRPSGSWHRWRPDVLPSRLQWNVVSGGGKWHRAFCVPEPLPCNCHKRKRSTTPFRLAAHAPGEGIGRRTQLMAFPPPPSG